MTRLVDTRRAAAEEERAGAQRWRLEQKKRHLVATEVRAANAEQEFLKACMAIAADAPEATPDEDTAPKAGQHSLIGASTVSEPTQEADEESPAPEVSEENRLNEKVDLADALKAAENAVAEMNHEQATVEASIRASDEVSQVPQVTPGSVAKKPNELPPIMSPTDWHALSNEGVWLTRRSAELVAVDTALAQYHEAYRLATMNRTDSNTALKTKYEALVTATDAWCFKELKDKNAWSNAKRAAAMTKLRGQVFSKWKPPENDEQTMTEYRFHQERQKLFCKLLVGRKVVNRVQLAVEKARESAKQGKYLQAVDHGVRGVNSAKSQTESGTDLADIVAEQIPTEQMLEAAKEEMEGLIVRLRAIRDYMKQFLPKKPDIERIFREINEAIKLLKDTLKVYVERVSKFLSNLAKYVSIKVDGFRQMFSAFRAYIIGLWDLFEQFCASLSLPNIDFQAWVALFSQINLRSVVAFIKSLIDFDLKIPRPDFSTLIRWLTDAKVALTAALERAKALANAASQVVGQVVDAAATKAREVAETMNNIADTICSEAKGFLAEIREKIQGFKHTLARLVRRVFAMLSNIVNSVVSGIGEIGKMVANWLAAISNLIRNNIEDGVRAFLRLMSTIFSIDIFDVIISTIPYIGSVFSFLQCGKAWYTAYKAVQKSQKAKKSIHSFSRDKLVQGIHGSIKEEIQDRAKEAVIGAGAATAEAIMKVAGDIALPMSSTLVALGAAVAKAALGLVDFISQYRENKAVNQLLAKLTGEEASTNPSTQTPVPGSNESSVALAKVSKQISEENGDILLEVVQTSPLLACYMVCLAGDEMLLNLQFVAESATLSQLRAQRIASALPFYGESTWEAGMAQCKKDIKFFRDFAKKVIGESHWTIDELEEKALEEAPGGGLKDTLTEHITETVKEQGKEKAKAVAENLFPSLSFEAEAA